MLVSVVVLIVVHDVTGVARPHQRNLDVGVTRSHVELQVLAAPQRGILLHRLQFFYRALDCAFGEVAVNRLQLCLIVIAVIRKAVGSRGELVALVPDCRGSDCLAQRIFVRALALVFVGEDCRPAVDVLAGLLIVVHDAESAVHIGHGVFESRVGNLGERDVLGLNHLFRVHFFLVDFEQQVLFNQLLDGVVGRHQQVVVGVVALDGGDNLLHRKS